MESYKSNAVVKDIVEGKVASIYIPSMISYDAIEQDRKLITEYLNKVKDYQALVIDIRGNGGGDSSYWVAFLLPLILKEHPEVKTYSFYKEGELVEEHLKNSGKTILKVEDLDLSKFSNLPPEVSEDFTYYIEGSLEILPDEENYIGFNGNIYLLVDGKVFSSAESLAIYAKETGFATIIGEQTKGDGVGGFDDPILEILPNSGYVFRYPEAMGVTSDGTCNNEYGTTPDYIVNSSKYPDELINLD
ncbi:MAG: peptidase, partial [Eubacteriales bacterium]|nr:peptidase [Eubacteriales bacterium]